MKKFISLFAAIACAASSFAQQKLPCTVADINAALDEYDKKVLSTSQYLLLDINADGIKDVIVRDSDLPSASYAVFLLKNGKLEMENFAYDGYETLGYAKGGYSFYEHDDHMGANRTWDRGFSRYQNGKEIMKGNLTVSIRKPEREDDEEFSEDGEQEFEEYCSINDKTVTREEFDKIVPEPIWFYQIDKGWRMVKNNQLVTKYSENDYDIYDGTIGEYPVVLCFNKGKQDGFYFYKSRPENKFTLKCVSKTDDDDYAIIEVKEYLPDGNSTGTFKGKYRKGSSFTGTFTNSEDKTFGFSMYWK